MCNLYSVRTTLAALMAAFAATLEAADDPPSLDADIYPKALTPVVRAVDGARRAETMRWGFPPPAGARAPVTNVRNLHSPFWRAALATPARRCLVPASRFCEWEGEAGAKRKRWFAVADRLLFAFAGVWRAMDDGPPAFAFLTCEPNPLVAPIHPKSMPVILHPEDHDAWLTAPLARAIELAAPFPSQLMTVD